MDKAFLQHIAYYLPEDTLTNDELSSLFPEWSPEKILKKTGVETRHISAANETAVDMAEKAARKLFEESGVSKDSVDFVILCTQSPDYYLPTSACIIQDRLGINEKSGAFDFNLGCSGYVYGLGIAKGLIESGQAKCILLLTSETYTKYLHPDDKSCRTIFGDGAAASIISSGKQEGGFNARIDKITYRTIGSHFQSLIVENGCSRNPKKGETSDIKDEEGAYVRNADNLFMDGRDIFDFSAHAVPEVIDENIKVNCLEKEDIDLFVFHQANAYMLNFVKMRAKLPSDKVVVDLKNLGNTVSSTIPIALCRRNIENPIERGAKVMLCGFGVGLSVGAVTMSFE